MPARTVRHGRGGGGGGGRGGGGIKCSSPLANNSKQKINRTLKSFRSTSIRLIELSRYSVRSCSRALKPAPRTANHGPPACLPAYLPASAEAEVCTCSRAQSYFEFHLFNSMWWRAAAKRQLQMSRVPFYITNRQIVFYFPSSAPRANPHRVRARGPGCQKRAAMILNSGIDGRRVERDECVCAALERAQ